MALAAEIHSALRALIRAQRITFSGDVKALQASRELNRALLAPALDPASSQEQRTEAIQGAHQAALYFRQHVLQGVAESRESNYALRITPETKLGDNESIKNVAPAPSLDEIVKSKGTAVKRRRRQAA